MIKQIIGGILLMAAVQQVSALELDQIRSLEVPTTIKFRGYADRGQTPTSVTAFNQKSAYPSCNLAYLPNSNSMKSNLFKVVDSEPKYDGGRVDIFNLTQKIELQITKVKSEVKEAAQECALPDHPELCDENPPMVKSKTTIIDMVDADLNRWYLLCISEEIESSRNIEPVIETADVVKNFGPLNLK